MLLSQEEFDSLNLTGVVCLDFETSSLSPHNGEPLLLQLYNGQTYLIDCREINFSKLLDWDCTFVMHNAKFDMKWIYHRYGRMPEKIFCTYLAETIITNGLKLKLGLDDVAERYLNITLDKETRKTFINHVGEFSQEQLDYATKDAEVLMPIYEAQKKILEKDNLTHIADLEFELSKVVAKMELAGVLIDQVGWRKLIEENRIIRDRLASELKVDFRPKDFQWTLDGDYEGINFNSPKQVIKGFAEKGVKIPNTEESTLRKLKNPSADKLLEYREYEKRMTSFGEGILKLINPFTDRLHTEFGQNRTSTSRFCSSAPNLQQVPKEQCYRSLFIAPKGKKIIGVDYEGMEFRILASLSQDNRLLKAFREGIDVHINTASLMYGISASEVDDDKRYISKVLGYGLSYGMSEYGLSNQMNISVGEAKKRMRQFHQVYPTAIRYLENRGTEATQKGYAICPYGRRRWYKRPDTMDTDFKQQVMNIKRSASNFDIQCLGATICKLALIEIDKHIKNGQIILQIHDEILVECDKDWAEYNKVVMMDCMMEVASRIIKDVPLTVSAKIGDCWTK